MKKRQITAFDVDLPSLQQRKRVKVTHALLNLKAETGKVIDTSHVRYVSTDFNMNQLPTSLKENGYKASLKSIFTLEGVGNKSDLLVFLSHKSPLM